MEITLPFGKNGEQLPLFHKIKSTDNGGIALTGYDPEGVIVPGYKIQSMGIDSYEVDRIYERRVHKGRPDKGDSFVMFTAFKLDTKKGGV